MGELRTGWEGGRRGFSLVSLSILLFDLLVRFPWSLHSGRFGRYTWRNQGGSVISNLTVNTKTSHFDKPTPSSRRNPRLPLGSSYISPIPTSRRTLRLRTNHGYNPKDHQKQRNRHHSPRHRRTALIPTPPSLPPLELPITFLAVRVPVLGCVTWVGSGAVHFNGRACWWWWCIVVMQVGVALEVGFGVGDAGVLLGIIVR